MFAQIVSTKSIIRKRLKDTNLLQYARENRDEGFFSDVTVTTGNESIAANRMVLSCYSKYFEKMFKASFKERYSNTVEVQGAPETAVKSIIDYFYFESIEIKGETVMDLLAASDYLQVDDVKQFCFDFLQSNISPLNCFLIIKVANLYGNNVVADCTRQYISQNFTAVIKTDEFKLLSKSDLITCLLKLDQKLVEQITIYQALIAWIRYEKSTREKEFAELFRQLVDVNKLCIMDVEGVLLKEDLITDDANCCKVVLTALSKIVEEKRVLFIQRNLSKVISLGGWNTAQSVCHVYNMQDKFLQSYPDLPEMARLSCSLKLNDCV